MAYILFYYTSFNQNKDYTFEKTVIYLDKPVITVQSETNACDGELVNIDCKIDAKPDIYSLQWYRIIDGQLVELLQTSKHYTGGNTRHPALSIVNIAKDDEGTYICKASNSVGEGLSGECKLKVFCEYYHSDNFILQ